MKQYKIDAFKGYEKFMKKIGRKAREEELRV